MRGDRSQRLTILSEAEKLTLYGLPDFDDFQRVEFFAMTNAEHDLALRRDGLLAQVYCLLQTGYFARGYCFSSAAVFSRTDTNHAASAHQGILRPAQ